MRVRIPAGAAGEFSSPELTLCADSYSVSVPPLVLPQWHIKDRGHFAKVRVAAVTPKRVYTLVSKKSKWADYAAEQA